MPRKTRSRADVDTDTLNKIRERNKTAAAKSRQKKKKEEKDLKLKAEELIKANEELNVEIDGMEEELHRLQHIIATAKQSPAASPRDTPA